MLFNEINSNNNIFLERKSQKIYNKTAKKNYLLCKKTQNNSRIFHILQYYNRIVSIFLEDAARAHYTPLQPFP